MRRNYKDELRIKKRKKTASRVFLALFIVMTASIGLIYLLFFANMLDRRFIDVSGAENVSRDELKTVAVNWLDKKFLGISRGKNLFFVSARDLAQELAAKFPRIDAVEVKKKMPHGLEISITERKPAGIWCFAVSVQPFDNARGKCFYFDKDGVAYAETGPSSGFLILSVIDYRTGETTLGSPVTSEEWFKNIMTAGELLPKIGIDVAEFIIPSGSFDEFDAKTAPGWKVLFSNSADIAKQIASLGILLRDKLPPEKRTGLQYIDLRIQDRIYYK